MIEFEKYLEKVTLKVHNLWALSRTWYLNSKEISKSYKQTRREVMAKKLNQKIQLCDYAITY